MENENENFIYGLAWICLIVFGLLTLGAQFLKKTVKNPDGPDTKEYVVSDRGRSILIILTCISAVYIIFVSVSDPSLFQNVIWKYYFFFWECFFWLKFKNRMFILD